MSEATTDEALEGRLLLDPAVLESPYDFFGRLRAESPVWAVPGTSIVVVSSFAAVTEATNRTAELSSNLRGVLCRGDQGEPAVYAFDDGLGADVLAVADPPVHARHRAAVFPQLVARRMVTLRDDVERIAHELVDRATRQTRIEAMGAIANAIPIRVLSRLIGWQHEDPDRLLAAAFDSTAVVGATPTHDDIDALMVRTAEIMEWITAQLHGAGTDAPDGILGTIAQAVDLGQLTEFEGIVIMHTLLSAGGESTTSLLGNAIHLLATDHDLQDRVRDEPALVTPLIEEVLRVESPFRYHLRHATADTEIHGTTIPAGSTVLLMWAAANRDPAEYDRPDEIVLDRPAARHHLGFGRGIHLCVGASLARMEAEVVIRRLLERTEHLALDPDDRPAREYSLMVRRFTRLPIALTPRPIAPSRS